MHYAGNGRNGDYVSPKQKLVAAVCAIGIWIPVVNVAVLLIGVPLYIYMGFEIQREESKKRKAQSERARLERGDA